MKITFEKIGKSGWYRGGRIKDSRNYIKSSYQVYINNELIGYMSEKITGADIRTGWTYSSFNQPSIDISAINATKAKSVVKQYITNQSK